MGARRLHGSEGTPAFHLIFYLFEPICSKTVHKSFPFNPKLNIVAQNGDVTNFLAKRSLFGSNVYYTQAF